LGPERPVEIFETTERKLKPVQYVFIINDGRPEESTVEQYDHEGTIGKITHLLVLKRLRENLFVPTQRYEVLHLNYF